MMNLINNNNMFIKWKQISVDVYKHPIIERQSIDIV